jgi:hypothetical protein
MNMGTSSGYATAPTFINIGGSGSGFTATFTVVHNVITAINNTSGGSDSTPTTPVTITQAGATASNFLATDSTSGTITGISGGTSSEFQKLSNLVCYNYYKSIGRN